MVRLVLSLTLTPTCATAPAEVGSSRARAAPAARAAQCPSDDAQAVDRVAHAADQIACRVGGISRGLQQPTAAARSSAPA